MKSPQLAAPVWRKSHCTGPNPISHLGAGAAGDIGRDRRSGERVPWCASDDGWFEAEAACGAGTRYRYMLEDGTAIPDPASRAQAGDVHGWSLVVDPYTPTDGGMTQWHGRPWHETVVYELHAGVFGGFAGVARELPRLAELGMTAVELMPIAEFPGARNWGYDGVLPFAPECSYGTPDDLKALDRRRARPRPDDFPGRRLQSFRARRKLSAGSAPPKCFATTCKRPGGRRSTFAGRKCAVSLPRTRCTGCSSIASTDCGSTPCMPLPSQTGLTKWPPRCARRSVRSARSIWCWKTTTTWRAIWHAISTPNGTTTAITSCTCC